MPADFEKCIKTSGSKKVTKSLGDGKYIHGCQFPSGEWVWGEVHEAKGAKLRKLVKGR